MAIAEFKVPKKSKEALIRENVMKRQKLKKDWDRVCKYGADKKPVIAGSEFAFASFDVAASASDNWARLLDEGVVVDGDGSVFAVIAKGALKNWYEGLSNSFVGSINKDHNQSIDLGTFRKSDLRLVELKNGRYGLDVNLKLDDELYAVKDLKRMMNRKALSAEFYFDYEETAKASAVTGDEKQGDWQIPIINEVSITAFAVVDNPKNANSYDEQLLEKASSTQVNEGETMNEEIVKADEEAVQAELSSAGAPEVEEVVEPTPEETPAEVEATEEEVAPTETQEETEEPAEEPAPEATLSADEIIGKIEELKAELAAREAEIADLKAKLSAKETEQASFASRLEEAFKLNFAVQTDEPTAAEGGKPTSIKEENEDAYSAAVQAAFAKMEG